MVLDKSAEQYKQWRHIYSVVIWRDLAQLPAYWITFHMSPVEFTDEGTNSLFYSVEFSTKQYIIPYSNLSSTKSWPEVRVWLLSSVRTQVLPVSFYLVTFTSVLYQFTKSLKIRNKDCRFPSKLHLAVLRGLRGSLRIN